jgi:hypothetical protein
MIYCPFSLLHFLTIKGKIMEKEYRFMDVELVLGNPKIECDGYGICKIVQKGHTTLSACEKKRLIDCKISIVEQTFIILMSCDTIINKNCINYFKDDIFRMETSITVPNWLTTTFDLSTVILQTGNYKAKKQHHFFQVDIPFVENIMGTLPPQYFEVQRAIF